MALQDTQTSDTHTHTRSESSTTLQVAYILAVARFEPGHLQDTAGSLSDTAKGQGGAGGMNLGKS